MGSIIISVAVVAAGVVLGLARGGRVDALLTARPQWPWLLIGGFALHALTENVDVPQARSLAVIALFMLVVGLVMNASIRGALITAFGVTLNLLVLVLNGAVPVRFEALREAGIIDASVERASITSVGHLLELETSATRFGSLGDTIPLGWLDVVISIGDLVTFAGVIVIVSNLIAAPRRVGLNVDDVFGAPAAIEQSGQFEAAPTPNDIIDLVAAEPLIDVTDATTLEPANRGAHSARVTADDDPFDPDDLWADDDSGVRILGPSSKPT